MRIVILNGPNLNLLGSREPEIYGTATLTEVEKMCRERAVELGLEIEFRQTNHEGELIGWLAEAWRDAAGVILNPAAFTHYSLALREAVAAAGVPVIEVHISNIYAREPWRERSVISAAARGVIAGLGVSGYLLALEALAELVRVKGE
ncbi:MAG: type II 3-dehydroquinate dehydratase [Acidimicrobiales bacterium]